MSASEFWFETRETNGTLRTRWDEAAGVELIAPLDEPDEEWVSSTASSPFVDGEFETHSSLGRMLLPMHVVVRGESVADCRRRYDELKADLHATHSLGLRIVKGPVAEVYRAYRPSISSPGGMSDVHPERDVHLTWRVLPHPTIEGI